MGESIVPRNPDPEKYTPVLRADATDDGDLPEFASGGPVRKRHKDEVLPGEDIADDGRVDGKFVLSCPVCGLEECKHNVAKAERFVPDGSTS